jgi:hypothetical protein
MLKLTSARLALTASTKQQSATILLSPQETPAAKIGKHTAPIFRTAAKLAITTVRLRLRSQMFKPVPRVLRKLLARQLLNTQPVQLSIHLPPPLRPRHLARQETPLSPRMEAVVMGKLAKEAHLVTAAPQRDTVVAPQITVERAARAASELVNEKRVYWYTFMNDS